MIVAVEDRATNGPLTLVTLPAEMLLEIAKLLPQQSFAALSLTCQRMQAFVKENASFICNNRLNVCHSAAVEVLGIGLDVKSGWMLPKSAGFTTAHDRVRMSLDNAATQNKVANGRIVKSRKKIVASRRINLSIPGPQLCAFLDIHAGVIGGKHRQLITNMALPAGPEEEERKEVAMAEFFKWVADNAIRPFIQPGLVGNGVRLYNGLFGSTSSSEPKVIMDGDKAASSSSKAEA